MNNYEVLTKADEDKGLIKAWTRGVPVDEASVKQLKNIAAMPFIHKWLAVMPDVHLGKGATVGSVIATDKAIIPAAVGVDIGCGMMAVRTSLKASDLPESLLELRLAIEAAVPHGSNPRLASGKRSRKPMRDKGSWGELDENSIMIKRYIEELQLESLPIISEFGQLLGKFNKAPYQLGTLGGGNHFIEVCLDKGEQFEADSNLPSADIKVEPGVWIMLHSGSRGIGNALGSLFIEKAKEEMSRFYINLPDEDLAYLPEGSQYFAWYMKAVAWAQKYARINREIMMHNTIKAMKQVLKRDFNTDSIAVNCHHNYVNTENHYGKNVYVTRKGAVRAREGDLGIIPGSMGAKSFIVRGKGNPESFYSCSHGAGRVLSRTKAEKEISLEQHIADCAGVECRLDEGVLDETPRAYKDIEAVMKAQTDLVDVLYELKQVLCVKG